MASQLNTGVTYRKIHANMVSFFDIAMELREQIYNEYFTAMPNYFVHLLNIDRASANAKRSARISTKYHHLVVPRDDDFPTQDRSVSADVEDLSEDTKESALVWSPLEAAAKALLSEAKQYSFHSSTFKVLGRESVRHRNWDGDLIRQDYHDDLTVLPPRLLSKIKSLDLPVDMVNHSFNVDDEGWTKGFWPVVLTQLVSLRVLTFSHLDLLRLVRILGVLTSSHARFLGKRPSVAIRIDVNGGSYWSSDECPSLGNRSWSASPMAARFLVPPNLEAIELFATAEWNFLNHPRSIEKGEWEGTNIRQVRTQPATVGPYPTPEVRFYEVEWPASTAEAASVTT